MDDALRLRAYLAGDPGPAVVLGGGVLGLEMASWLAKEGSRRVEVLEYASHLLPRQLDAEGGAVLQGLLAEKGVLVRTGARIAALEGDPRVESVVLEDGERIAASIVIPAMGARPRLGLAMAAGLGTGRGISVDRFMRTQDPSVYAVGDCAEFEGQVPGFVAAALDQAATAAAAILGDESRPWGAGLYQQSLKVSGIELFSEGRAAEPPQGAQVIRRSSERTYACLVLCEGILAGAAMIGSKEAWRRIQPLVGKAAVRADIEGLLGP
jgi:nitrite reductase (NADH) large subunit